MKLAISKKTLFNIYRNRFLQRILVNIFFLIVKFANLLQFGQSRRKESFLETDFIFISKTSLFLARLQTPYRGWPGRFVIHFRNDFLPVIPAITSKNCIDRNRA